MSSVWLLAECTVHVKVSSLRKNYVGEGEKESGNRKCLVLGGQDRVGKIRTCRNRAARWTIGYVSFLFWSFYPSTTLFLDTSLFPMSMYALLNIHSLRIL